MVLASRFVLVVKKTTGGRAWLPKWGFSGLTRFQKANKREQRKEEQSVIRALKEASEREPVKNHVSDNGRGGC